MKGFWWFCFAVCVGVIGWTGDKIFTIRNTEARVVILEKKDLEQDKAISSLREKQAEYNTDLKYIKEALDNINHKIK